MDSTLLSSLKTRFPARHSQLSQLANLFGHHHAEEPLPDAVFIYGGPSTGKTTIISELLTALQINYAYINLIECYTPKILYESILNQLTGHRIDPRLGQPYAKCDSLMEFIENLNQVEVLLQERFMIVLDKTEQLRSMSVNIMSAFLRFKEMSRLNVSVVFISEIPFQKYSVRSNIVEPLKIRFPQYNSKELQEILANDYEYVLEHCCTNLGADFFFDLDFFRSYLNVFLSMFYRACRDLSELRYLSRLNFPKYCEPIAKGTCSFTDSMALWRHISPVLKNSLDVLYLRVTTREEEKSTMAIVSIAQSLELPYYSKYLLIAAYLASYNPAKDDKRIFMKHHGKKQKSLKQVKTKSKVSERLNTQLGPKPFTLDRLLAIFYAILDDKVGFNNNLLVQVSSLVELQLLTALSDNYNLDGQKYKCTVSFDFITSISSMVGFKIRKYLSDFSHM